MTEDSNITPFRQVKSNKADKPPPLTIEQFSTYFSYVGFTGLRWNMVTKNYEYEYKGVLKRIDSTTIIDVYTEVRDLHLKTKISNDLMNKKLVADYFKKLCIKNPINPIKQYIECCAKEDERLGIVNVDVITNFLDAMIFPEQKKDLFRKLTRNFLVGILARLYLNFQNHTLILQGEQGIGKSTLSHILMKGMVDYYFQGQIDPENKDHQLLLGTKLIIAQEELGMSFSRQHRDALKNYYTQEVIELRRSHREDPDVFQRVASIIGSTNDDEFLRDPTGNRRFLVIELLDVDKPKINSIPIDRLWGALYREFKQLEEVGFNHSMADGVPAISIFDLPSELKPYQTEINESYMSTDITFENIKRMILPYDKGNKQDFIATSDIVEYLREIFEDKSTNHKIAECMKRGKYLKALGTFKHNRKVHGYYAKWAEGFGSDVVNKYSNIRDAR